MERKPIKIFAIIMAMLMLMVQPVYARTEVPVKERVFTPKVITQKITTHTKELQVYVYDDTTLYVKNGTKVVVKMACQSEGLKTVKIAKQKGGSKLSFYLVYKYSGKKGKIVTRNVTSLPKVANETYNKSLKKPTVQKTITNQTNKVTVTLTKGMTLVIKNDTKLLKSVKYDKTESKTISIPVQKDGANLYFYGKKGSKRSAFTCRTVQDVIVPDIPVIKLNGDKLLIKGEVGTRVYVKIPNTGWVYRGVILDKMGLTITLQIPIGEETVYRVKLKDGAGNWSKAASISVKTETAVADD